ncbi:MAG: bifunctional pyr operon transcriptional regulator/uracil phosphoribosyltransferase [Bacteroidetes bacterium CG12_big_fil_rev_8_21_14_0_65_60_17]|nr:MAG: bifunctional pyr operon transcriptional regulator/uracil phosphoribosyltransferase [Bacteroidetes bacterium CG12_big_fil_rev_8_21_14_0_65_60_17]
MTARQVDRTLNRLACEILERNRGAQNVMLVGILQSGAAVAERLAAEIRTIETLPLGVYDLDTTAFRDDRPGPGSRADSGAGDTSPHHAEGSLPDVTDRDVVLVDDVLFTGRTVRAALDAIVTYGRPRSIQLAVLVDRGHREFPIQPDYVGRTMPTKHREDVQVLTDGGIHVDVVEERS